MPTSAEAGPQLLLDTSAAVALSLPAHDGRFAVLGTVRGQRIGLAGHAAFETYSLLTRLPLPDRLAPVAARRLIATNFPYTRYLSPRGAEDLHEILASKALAGGAVYDALVGAAAREQARPLLTCDRRALATYRALEVEVVFLG